MSVARTLRAERWWNGKLAPLVGVAAVSLEVRGGVTGRDLWRLGLFLVSAVGIAAFGHVLNDLTDRRGDAAAGKANPFATSAPWVGASFLAVTLVVGVLPWFVLDAGAPAWVLLVVQVGLLAGYSLPPVRLKVRGVLGAVADAGYAYVVPFLWAVTVFTEGWPAGWVTAVVATWAASMGLRGILWHQVADLEADRKSGARTAVSRMSPQVATAVIDLVLIPLEMVTSVVLVVSLARSGLGWLPFVVVGYLAWQAFQARYLWDEQALPAALHDRSTRIHLLGYVVGNEFLERWLPLVATVALAIAEPWWWIAVVVLLAGFETGVGDFVKDDVWGVPDAIERVVIDLTTWPVALTSARTYRRRRREGPADIDPDAPERGWVFVVCGATEHLASLAVAARALRGLTRLEIWVVTDLSRNAAALDTGNVDRVIDVATPAALDDHQASIWLKTGVHRHLPAREWCYLDTDVLAIRPGAEAVFDHRVGPIAFATDAVGGEQSVDKFSPFAMTCGCEEGGDGCEHLRQQLRVRFGLDVPGEWLHWNGGVFVFGPESGPFLDRWHDLAVESFGWPEWRTRDQGTLIAAAWEFGLQDQARVPSEFNYIADYRHPFLTYHPGVGWTQQDGGPAVDPWLIHLYTSPLHDRRWSFQRDLRTAVLRARTRRYRFRSDQYKHHAKVTTVELYRRSYWAVRRRLELQLLRLRRQRRRFRRDRVVARWRRAVGRDHRA